MHSLRNTAVSRPYLVLLAITAIALLLRCLLIGRESLWLDEAASWHFVSGGLAKALRAERTNPPLYYSLLYFWTSWFGTTEAALRSLSVLPATATIALTYLVGRRLISSGVGLVAAAYQALVPFQIYYAQEARAYALLLFFLTASFLSLINALDATEANRRWRWLGAYAVVTTLALYTHFIATFFIACHGVYVLLVCRRNLRIVVEYAAAAALSCIAFAPWLLAALTNAGRSGQSRRHVFLKIPQTYFSFLFGDTLIPLDERAVRDIAGTLREYAPELIAASLVVGIIAWSAARYLSRTEPRTWFAIAVMASGPVLISIAVWSKVQLFDERYLIGCTPYVYLTVAAGIVGLFRRESGRPRLAAAVAVTLAFTALVILSTWNYFLSPRFGREQWREAVRFIETNTPPGRTLIVLEPDYIHFCTDYYGRSIRDVQQLLVTPEVKPAFSAAVANGYDNVWLVRSHHSDDEVLHALQSLNEQSSAEFPKGQGISLRLFQHRSTAASGLNRESK